MEKLTRAPTIYIWIGYTFELLEDLKLKLRTVSDKQ